MTVEALVPHPRHTTSGHHPLPNLTPCHPLTAPLGQVLTLGNQALMNRTGEQGDAVPADLLAEVLTSHADL